MRRTWGDGSTRGAARSSTREPVVETGAELIAVLPTSSVHVEMATPLEGAIDRFGRLVDRPPGWGARGVGDAPTAADDARRLGRLGAGRPRSDVR